MRRDVVVVGASAGGVEALRTLVARLPADLPASVLVVLHVPSYGRSVLPAILQRAGRLPARHAAPEGPLRHGEIVVAPPDHHLVLVDDGYVVTRGPRENGHRPAIDVLFRSAARTAGQRVVGVEMTGVLDDGVAGMWAIRNRGGLVAVQDPRDCLYPEMPQNVMATTPPDHVASAADLGLLLGRLCREEFGAVSLLPPSPLLEVETEMAQMDDAAMDATDRPGTPAGFSCPDCGGTLFDIHDGAMSRYRCRIGHAWTAPGLLGEQSQQLDGALSAALRSLEEKAALCAQLARRAAERGNTLSARRFDGQAEAAKSAARTIRAMLESRPDLSGASADG